MKTKLFSVTKEDFEWQFFRAGGKGGQKQNKTSSACRCIHRASNAVGESRDERKQSQNRKIAFTRCVQSDKFNIWLKLTCGAILAGYKSIEAEVDKAMAEENIKIEYFTPEE
jgi:hypothetical protein